MRTRATLDELWRHNKNKRGGKGKRIKSLEKQRAARQDDLAKPPRKPKPKPKSKTPQVVADQRRAAAIPGTYKRLSMGDKSGVAWEKLRR